ncbi:MAG: phenylacetic acid degradation protein PaaN [Nocardioidaceae bacterium]|nr:phenylacetic acid degradation protein PaaN [Nocardioidaceae bacterium]
MDPAVATATLPELIDKHADLLARAQRATRTREYFSAFPESPSPRVYGEDAAAAGQSAFDALLGTELDLGQPTDGSWVGEEVSPYGIALGVRYPHASNDALLKAALRAVPSWQGATPVQRAAVATEILVRINARSFEMAHAVMHTSGQAFVMAFQAGGPHAQDRGLEAVAYALAEQERHAASVLWEKPQGKRPPLRMTKTFTPVSRGIALVIGCNTFPTWNSYPGMFASLVTGNAVIVKPHPRAVLPLALTVSIAREVLTESGFDPDVVVLAAERTDEPIAAELATDPRVGVIDFTGSTAFGEWLEDNARQALVYTEKAGVNAVIVESTDDYRGALANLAFTLSLYSGQMCTTTQNVYVPKTGVATDEGTKTPDDFVADLASALDTLLGQDDAKAAGILGAIVDDDVARRLEQAAAGPAAIPSRPIEVDAWPDARIRTPLVLRVDAGNRDAYAQECFGPISFVVETETRDDAVALLEDLTDEVGALTAGVYSTDEEFLDEVRTASLRAGVALSENLTGGVFVNQTTAFSDFHATGANRAANATYTDAHFVAGRFRVIEARRHAPPQ